MKKEQRIKILDNCDQMREMLLDFENKIMVIRKEVEGKIIHNRRLEDTQYE